MMRKSFKIHQGQKGVTGLETAIILIAFVVVASVFAYTTLTAGLFSTQKSQEAVYAGLQEAMGSLELRGGVIGYRGDAVISNSLGKVEFTVTTVLDGEDIDLTPPYTVNGTGGIEISGLSNPTIISFNDDSVSIAETAWTVAWVGYQDASGNNILQPREKAIITVWLHTYDGSAWADGASGTFLATYDVDTSQQFTIEVKPPVGAVLPIERRTPPLLDTIMDFH